MKPSPDEYGAPELPADWHDPLASAFRHWGYLAADLDPFGRLVPFEHPDLAELCDAAPEAKVEELQGIYCSTIGAQFMHLMDRERATWLSRQLEMPAPELDTRHLLYSLAEASLFERFLHSRYVGAKRYSLDGLESLMPLLDSILEDSLHDGAELVLLAMSHRGRLNAMRNIVGVPGDRLFASIEDVDPRSMLGGGDVKYHLGATGTWTGVDGRELSLHLVSNPSHLEAVDPVIMGRARARQLRRGEDGPQRILPITVHGDAAFAGQGVAAEVLNMADLPGYTVRGTIHIVANNLIGFTAQPAVLHSSRFSSDLARRQDIPILHVNAEDPEAVVRVGRIASSYRRRFGSDVVIDLIGHRKYGHSEVEDPTTTQPRLYAALEEHPVLFESYARKIGESDEHLAQLQENLWRDLEREQDEGRACTSVPSMRTMPPYWDPYRSGTQPGDESPDSAVEVGRLEAVGEALVDVPEDFHLHPKLQRLFESRLAMSKGESPVDWACAELLAMGTLLQDGYLVRMSGQDVCRGTFNQRHASLHDHENEKIHIPLETLAQANQTHFEIHDSPLSEAAVLGFEYGFSRDWPDGLVCWEAQFGDFANGAQIILDQYLAAAEDKWGLPSGLVVLLPHGFEGQGPEHSSARMERFLMLAAEGNMQVTQPSTAAQYFHLLRSQVLQSWRKPLIVFSPKGMLRVPSVSSPLNDLTVGGFSPVIEDPAQEQPQRILVCTGRIAHELAQYREKKKIRDVSIVRLERLYPFPEEELRQVLGPHEGEAEVIWVQEEPRNMGALGYARPLLQDLFGGRRVRTVRRAESASPATGSPKAHRMEQDRLLEMAFSPNSRERKPSA